MGKGRELSWFMDKGCSRCMKSTKSIFINLQKYEADKVAFRRARKGKILGIGVVRISSLISIINVLYVEK